MQLYLNLMKLVEAKKGFFRKDIVLDDQVYAIFSYELVSYTDFQLPDALWCRGTMFNVTDINNPVLVCRPLKKFFNWNEGGVNHSKNRLVYSMVKLDGSLISTYMHKGRLKLKSKASLNSIQASEAMSLLNSPSYAVMKNLLELYTKDGYTINLEYTSPTNRIVVGYTEPTLNVLSAIENATGDSRHLYALTTRIMKAVPKEPVIGFDYQEYIDTIKALPDGEGFVLGLEHPNGEPYQIKVKTDRYCLLHHSKDAIQSPKALLEIVLRGGSDDMKSLFADDPSSLESIAIMENVAIETFNETVEKLESLYQANKNLTRKDFAIKIKEEMPSALSCMMNLYLGREVDYIEYALNNIHLIFGDRGLYL